MIVLQRWNKNEEVKLCLICMAIILMLQYNKLETFNITFKLDIIKLFWVNNIIEFLDNVDSEHISLFINVL